MNETKLSTLEQLRAFVQGTQEVALVPAAGQGKGVRYAHVQALVRRFGYAALGREDKAVVLRYLERTTGYSRQQIARLVKQALSAKGLGTHYGQPCQGFTRRFTAADVRLAGRDRRGARHALRACDQAPHAPCAGSLRRCALRALGWHLGGAPVQPARPAKLQGSAPELEQDPLASGAHRGAQSPRPRRHGGVPTHRQRAPGRSGRGQGAVSHQRRGLRHAVGDRGHLREDQRGVLDARARAHSRPGALQRPGNPRRQRLGVHQSRRGSTAEETTHRVHQITTAPRANDNALAETKNGAVVRKHLGYAHIPQRFAQEVNAFVGQYLNPYVNFHRPCLFPQAITDAKGKITKRYPQHLVATPLEKLASLTPAQQNLKPGVSLERLQQQAARLSDFEAAKQLNQARTKLFASIQRRLKKAA